MKFVFFFTVLATYLGMMSYVMIRSWQVLPANNFLKTGFIVAYVVMFLLLMSGLFLEHILSPSAAKVITFVGYTFMLTVIYMLLSYFITDLVRLANHFLHFAPDGMIKLRTYVALISLIATSIALVYGNIRFNNPVVTNLSLETSAKPQQNKSLRIVAASDIHLGTSIDKKRLDKFVNLINAQNPDIILLAGDITDRSIGPVVEQNMKEELSLLKSKHGVYAINGNHEYYSGKLEEINGYLESSGINVLCDDKILVDSSLYIVGRNDRTNRRRMPLSEITKELNKDLPVIMMDHQPYNLEDAEQNNIDLQISGHTHNGQFFPINLVVGAMFEKAYGYLKKGNTHYYVSSGLGIWGPHFRVGTKSELVVIDFKY